MKSPILTQVYRSLAALAFIGSAVCIVATFLQPQYLQIFAIYAAGLLISGIISLGIAEVVYLIAKIEFNTRESSHSYQTLKTLQTIAKNTARTQNTE